MSLDRDERQEVTDIAALVAREAVQNAARGDGGLRLPTPITRLGTTQGTGATGAVVAVAMDGDTAPIPVVNATGRFLLGTERVLVHFAPPQGAYIIGTVGNEWGADVLIQGEELTADRATINIDNVPLDFDHLLLRGRFKSGGGDGLIRLRINGHSGASDYRSQFFEYATGNANMTFGDSDQADFTICWAPNWPTVEYGTVELRIYDYWSSEARFSVMGQSRSLVGFIHFNTQYAGSTNWTPTGPVTRLELTSTASPIALKSRYELVGVGSRARAWTAVGSARRGGRLMDIGSAVVLGLVVVGLVSLARSIVYGTTQDRVVSVVCLVVSLIAVLLVAASDFAATEVVLDRTLESLNLASQLVVALLLSGIASASWQGLKAVRNIGDNQDVPAP